jgi:hypothetical protein
VQVAGKAMRELKKLPKDGILYPIVGLRNNKQSVFMIALPELQ